MKIPQLVAHRGYAKRFPENSLIGIEAALEAGACFIELDVQLTSDGVPVLLHDVSLLRTTGIRKRILNTNLEQVKSFEINETERLKKKFRDVTIPTLTEVVSLFQDWPKVKVFVELKKESLEKFGIEFTVKSVLEILKPIPQQFALISKNALAIRCARAMGATEIGWILSRCDQASKDLAAEFVPDYIFCNYTKVPKSSKKLWTGPWKWVLYEVTTPSLALELAEKGADFVETMAISEMLKSPKLRSRGCVAV